MKLKALTFLLIISSLSIIILSFRTPEPGVKFHHLKVLPKDISKKQLDSTMDYFAISLGVRCGYCHARWKDSTRRGLDFESDAKPEKDRAREMFKMTKYLNDNYFDPVNSTQKDTLKTITCFTCHRGAKAPSYGNIVDQFRILEKARAH